MVSWKNYSPLLLSLEWMTWQWKARFFKSLVLVKEVFFSFLCTFAKRSAHASKQFTRMVSIWRPLPFAMHNAIHQAAHSYNSIWVISYYDLIHITLVNIWVNFTNKWGLWNNKTGLMLGKMLWAKVKSGGDTSKLMSLQQVSWANLFTTAALHYSCHFPYELLPSCQIYLPFHLKTVIRE